MKRLTVLFFYASLMLVLVVLFVACGGSESSSPTATGTGVFLDNTVVGLRYTSGGLSGKTDNTGTFTWSGSTVTFKVGDIVIGTAEVAPVITPASLVAQGTINDNASTRTAADNQVLDITRFLRSISDNTAVDGKLHILASVDNAAIGKTINFATDSAATIDAMIHTIAGGSVQVYTRDQAAGHLKTTVLGVLAGNYAGRYSAVDNTTKAVLENGNWASTLTAGAGIGNYSGWLMKDSGNPATDNSTMTGTVNPNGVLTWSSAKGTGTGTINIGTGALSATLLGSGPQGHTLVITVTGAKQ